MSTAQLFDQLIQEMQGGSGSLSAEKIDGLIKALPHINESQLDHLGEKESSCPICFTPYLALIAQEEIAFAMESPAHPVDTVGVTKLSQPWQCGHVFCRRDISKWIIDGHDSCPLCRHSLVKNDQSRQVNTNADESPPPNTAATTIRANIEELTAQIARVGGIIPVEPAFGFYHPDPPLQREENAGRDAEYSAMYS